MSAVSQRKILFACFSRHLEDKIKVSQLAGSVAEISAHHHGKTSLMSAIINLAQDFIGKLIIDLIKYFNFFYREQ